MPHLQKYPTLRSCRASPWPEDGPGPRDFRMPRPLSRAFWRKPTAASSTWMRRLGGPCGASLSDGLEGLSLGRLEVQSSEACRASDSPPSSSTSSSSSSPINTIIIEIVATAATTAVTRVWYPSFLFGCEHKAVAQSGETVLKK